MRRQKRYRGVYEIIFRDWIKPLIAAGEDKVTLLDGTLGDLLQFIDDEDTVALSGEMNTCAGKARKLLSAIWHVAGAQVLDDTDFENVTWL